MNSNPSERPPRTNLMIASGRSPGLQDGKYPQNLRLPMFNTVACVNLILVHRCGGSVGLWFANRANSPTSRFNSIDRLSSNT